MSDSSDRDVWAGLDPRGLFDAIPEAMVLVDRPGRIVAVNPPAETLFGYRSVELEGRTMEVLLPEAHRQQHVALRTGFTADPHPRQFGATDPLLARAKDGTEFLVNVALAPIGGPAGLLVAAVIRPITDHEQADRMAEHIAAVVEYSPDAIISFDLTGAVTSWNPAAESLFGYSEAEVIGANAPAFIPRGHGDALDAIVEGVSQGGRFYDIETRALCKDGTEMQLSLTVSPIRDRSGQVTGVSATTRDVTAQRRQEQQLRFLADHDPLTGLHNRRRFELDLRDETERARRYGEQAALILIDLDRLKAINDTYGHQMGDRALIAVASAMRKRARTTDMVARLAGDEFAMVLPHASAKQAMRIGEDLRRTVAETPLEAGPEHSVRLGISFGVTHIDAAHCEPDVLLREADEAMYANKPDRNPSLDGRGAGSTFPLTDSGPVGGSPATH